MVQDFMISNEINKRVRNLANSNNTKNNNRFNVNIDELRQYNPRLATFIISDPLTAMKMF